MSPVQRITESRFFRKYKHYLLTATFLFGFVLDNLTLNRVDQVFDNAILASYVVLSMIALLLLYASTAHKLPTKLNTTARNFAPFLVQFAFGGLLSGMLVFYSRSGSWAQSWPYLLVILLVIYGNESIHDRAGRLVFNLAIFFVGLFSYMVLIIPVLTGKMGEWIFLSSGALALIIIYLFIQTLSLVIPNFLRINMRSVVFTIGAIYVSMNALYFTNLIPPIPLSLKHVGIYHSVVRFDTGEYQLKYEPGEWWRFWKDSDTVFHPQAGGNVFCFAKVFAPTKLSTDIYHKWEYYDEAADGWVEYFRTSYAIAGGNDGGYRGYTLISNYTPGKWRCTVETGRGQVLGREVFEVAPMGAEPILVTRVD